MYRTLLKSKIHRATVTAADLHYEGSITVDPALLDAADIREHEQVHVYNITRGTRLTTYALRGRPASGEIQINGAAAHLVREGDLVIIASYAQYAENEAARHEPRILLVDRNNRVKKMHASCTVQELPVESGPEPWSLDS